eukprot:XP_001706491.1 Hypothetical protein GL50803_17330 [Giardia lamblia ATCC 50803]
MTTMEIPIVMRKDALSANVQTNLVVIPKDIYLPMYDADLISELEIYKNRYLFVFLAQKKDEEESKRGETAVIRFYILEPEKEESEIILGANFVYLRDKDDFELRMERAIPYKIIDSYMYYHNITREGEHKKTLQAHFKELSALYQEIIDLRIKERELAGGA